MAEPRYDRIFPLKELHAYPGTGTLDMTFWLPPAEDRRRRVWMMSAAESAGMSEVAIDDAVLVAKHATGGTPRWVDYGVAEVPTGFTQLRIRALAPTEAARAYLVVSSQLGVSFAGDTIEEAERKLWGLARADAGSTTLSPRQLTVGSPARFIVRYTAGPKGLPAGALVRFTLPKAFDRPQVSDADGPGFVAIGQRDADVAIASIEDSIESHEKVDIHCRIEGPLAPRRGFELTYRTNRTYIFPNLFRDVDRRYWYSKLPPLQAAVAISPDRPFVSLAEGNGHSLEFVPGPAERLHLFLPGRVFVTDKPVLRGTFTDRYRNVPPSGIIDAEFELDLVGNNARISLGTPAGHYTARHRFAIPLPDLGPGVYRAVARRREGDQIVARSNPMEIVEEGSGALRVYWGEIHGHSEMSDGCGDFAEMYRHAREEGCLDFAASGDHSCYHSDNEWLWMQDVTNAHNAPGRFVTLVGYEWAGKQVHRNVYTSRGRLKLFRGMYPPTSRLDAVWREFHSDPDVVGGPHGGLAHGLVWEHHDPDVERFVEIYSMWGANDTRDNPLVPGFARRNRRGITANELLQRGAKLGFTGGGDCHEGHAGFSSEDPDGQGTTPHTFAARLLYRCGMTAAVVPRLDRASLIEALRNRRTYATTGARILLDFGVSGVPMGSEGDAREAICRATVHAVQPIQTIEIVKDGAVAWQRGCDALEATVEWQDSASPVREHYYYLHVIQSDGEQAWSSPVWITPSQ